MKKGFLRSFRGLVVNVALSIWVALPHPCAAWGDSSEPHTADSSCKFTARAMPIVTRIRGLDFTRDIPCSVRPQEEIVGFIQRTINTKYPLEKLRRESEVFQAIGMIPVGYPYESKVVALYAGQIGGYYDPDTAEFIMASRLPEETRLPVIIHELTHGLQDQWFPLNRILDSVTDNSDLLLARMALIEGDASSVTMRWGQEAGEPRIEQMVVPDERSAGDDYPLSIRKLMVFPYLQGTAFVETMLAQGGYKRLDAVLKRLPRSTEEILHPEQYERDQPDFEVIKPDKLRRAVQSVYPTLSFGDPVYTDVLGEAGISALGAVLPLGKESQEPLGAGWGGDLVGLFEERQRSAVVWITSWDTQAAAQRFEREMRRALEDRCKIKNAPFCQINFERDGKTLTLVVSDRSRRSSTQNVPGPVPEKSDDSASHP